MLTTDQIKKVALLAKLDISDNTTNIESELNNFVQLIDSLKIIDTKNIEPMSHPFDCSQRLRQDEIDTTNKQAMFQNIAPEISQNHYLVPTIL